MKYQKYFLSIIILILMFAAGCGQSETTPETSSADTRRDINELCTVLLNGKYFEDELSLIDTSYCEMLLGISDEEYENVILYMGSGATSEQFVIFETADKEKAAAIKGKCDEYISSQTAAYADYMPKEVDRLNKACVNVYNDKYVVLCVASDSDGSEAAISDFFK